MLLESQIIVTSLNNLKPYIWNILDQIVLNLYIYNHFSMFTDILSSMGFYSHLADSSQNDKKSKVRIRVLHCAFVFQLKNKSMNDTTYVHK